MQWFLLFVLGFFCFLQSKSKWGRWVGKVFLTACLLASMGIQWVLLWIDGQFSIATALPLHLCGVMAILCLALLWIRCDPLYELCALLGAPAAFLALCFPAVAISSHQTLMTTAFFTLHASIVCVPFFLCLCGQPLPTDPRRAMVLVNLFLLMVCLFNRRFDTNYLFLQYAPMGTPLAIFQAQGNGFYIASLEMICLVLTLWLSHLYQMRTISRNN